MGILTKSRFLCVRRDLLLLLLSLSFAGVIRNLIPTFRKFVLLCNFRYLTCLRRNVLNRIKHLSDHGWKNKLDVMSVVFCWMLAFCSLKLASHRVCCSSREVAVSLKLCCWCAVLQWTNDSIPFHLFPSTKKKTQYTYNVTSRNISITIDAVEKLVVLYIPSVCF